MIRDVRSLRGEGMGAVGQFSVWIVLPTLNEANNIVPMLEALQLAVVGTPHWICIVDDESHDGTQERIEGFRRAHPELNVEVIHRKKTRIGSQRGIAVWTGLQRGFLESHADAFVEMDADLSHRPEELATGLDMIKGGAFNVVIASKYVTGSRVVNRPWGRRALSAVANAIVRRLITTEVRDYSNGYRFYDRKSVEFIARHRLRYGSPIYLTEILALLLGRGMRVGEFASTYVGRGEGLSKLRIIDLLKACIAALDIAIGFHSGRYTVATKRLSASRRASTTEDDVGTTPRT
jgi:dolichol-phosphate mannosyltransferase